MKDRLIEKWERIGLIISAAILFAAGFIEIFTKCLTTNYPTTVSIITGLAGGVIATIIVLYFERKHEQTKLQDYYFKYDGYYKRTDMGQDNTPDTDLVGMRNENNGLDIKMTYLGGHEFSLLINYWKSENAKAKGFIEFNPKDKQSARGNYRYIEGDSYVGEFSHYGQLELNWDENKKEMIVIYHHQHPRKIPFNPDNNRGWEIWKKTNENNCC
jgi:hypothetical protein